MDIGTEIINFAKVVAPVAAPVVAALATTLASIQALRSVNLTKRQVAYTYINSLLQERYSKEMHEAKEYIMKKWLPLAKKGIPEAMKRDPLSYHRQIKKHASESLKNPGGEFKTHRYNFIRYFIKIKDLREKKIIRDSDFRILLNLDDLDILLLVSWPIEEAVHEAFNSPGGTDTPQSDLQSFNDLFEFFKTKKRFLTNPKRRRLFRRIVAGWSNFLYNAWIRRS